MATKAQLLKEAESVEVSANENLTAWTLIGQTEKYALHMQKAADLRRAAELKGWERSDFMQSRGI